MIRIAHRGLLRGPDKTLENRPDQIELALSLGYEVEVDVWSEGFGQKWWLGHDDKQYPVSKSFLERKSLWLHCKNVDALIHAPREVNHFWHENDAYTLTSTGIVWVYPGQKVPINRPSVCVLPENTLTETADLVGELQPLFSNDFGIWGICTDYFEIMNDYLKEQLTF